MVAYERYITVAAPDQIVISGLPLRAGQRVRVTVVVDERDESERLKELRALLKQTQSLPAARTVTDEEIAAQVSAARASAA
jgi:antitoxin ParD1/3/4